jgi:membrane protein
LRLLWQAYRLWDRHDCIDLSAAFAYHTLQSIFPILLIALAVAGRILGRIDGLSEQLIELADQFLPGSVVPMVSTTLAKLVRQGIGAGVVGALFLLITSTNAYLSLKRGADRLWRAHNPQVSAPHSFGWHLRDMLKQRLKAVGGALLLSVLLLINQVTTPLKLMLLTLWEALSNWSLVLPDFWQVPARSFTFAVGSWIGLLFISLLLLLYLPSRRPPLLLLWPGAILIATALTLVNPLLGGLLVWASSRFLAYGLVGGVILLTLWVWLVGLILYFGMASAVALAMRPQGGDPHPET